MSDYQVATMLIHVRTRFRGFHAWPSAPVEVSFLCLKHRHEFYVDITMPVEHTDREQEFFLVQQQLDSIIEGLYKKYWDDRIGVYDLGPKSCEMIAVEIGGKLLDRYTTISEVTVSVSEDNENGSILRILKGESST